MPETHGAGHVQAHPEPGHAHYEKKDINTGGAIRFVVGLAVALIVIHMIILGLYFLLAAQARNAQPKLSPVVEKGRKELPRDLTAIPEPRLQTSDVADFAEWQARQKAKLENYGWVDEKKSVVRIPIEQAMKFLADPKKQAEYGLNVAK
jgi:hypothetical protein